MNPSNSTSRDYTLDAGQEDGVRPLGAEADSATPDATDTGPNAVTPARPDRALSTRAHPLPPTSPRMFPRVQRHPRIGRRA